MISKIIFAVCSLAVSLVFGITYAKDHGDILCAHPPEGVGVLSCSRRERFKVSNRLDNSYKSAVSRIRSRNAMDTEFVDAHVEKLRVSQKAWIWLREKNCELETFEIEKGSIVDVVETNVCAVKMGNERIRFLNGVGYD